MTLFLTEAPYFESKKISPLKIVNQWFRICKLIQTLAPLEFAKPYKGHFNEFGITKSGSFIDHHFIVSSNAVRTNVQVVQWFKEKDYKTISLEEDVLFAGDCDLVYEKARKILWLGHGIHSNLAAGLALKRVLSREILLLKLVMPDEFPTLSSCFSIALGHVFYYPEALDQESNLLIEQNFPIGRRIQMSLEDASNQACDSLIIKDMWIGGKIGTGLKHRLRQMHLRIAECDLGEVNKLHMGSRSLFLRI